MVNTPQHSPYLSIQYMLTSGLGFTLMAVCVKLANFEGIPLFEIIAVRAFVSLVLSYLTVKRKGLSPWGSHYTLLSLRGALGTVALVGVYYALTELPLAVATIIHNTSPILTSVLAFLFLKEKVQSSTIISIIFGMIGVFIVTNPDIIFVAAESNLSTNGILAAIGAAICSSFAFIVVKKLSKTEDPSVIVLYFPLFALPASLFLLGDDFILPNLYQLGLLILIGIFTQVGQVYLTKAMKIGDASKTVAYSYVQILFVIIFGYLVFDEAPTLSMLLGASLIIMGALVNVFKGR
ncbi:DMT family transporter [Vibrio sp.]|nr:DMT family transporter [Vibrio sp.]